MAGIFGLSVNPAIYRGKFLEDLFWGTFYVQHLGEEYGGLSTANKGEIKVRTHRGLFRPSFTRDLEGLDGTEGIGYCGPDREPYLADTRLGEISLCFSGNVINFSELVETFKSFGHTFQGSGDIEILTKVLAQGNSITDGIRKLAKEIRGAYSLLILSKERVYGFRDPAGRWPLVIGEKQGAAVVSSESGGFKNLGFHLCRDIEPGEIVFLRNGSWEIKDKMEAMRIQFCSFYWVYTGFPNAIVEGILASLVRKRLGACLAKRDIERGFIPDIVSPVPDSGKFHAAGYHREFCEQAMEGRIKKIPVYDEALLKYPYAGRSFTPQSQEARDQEAQIKLLESGEEDFTDKVLVVCDDSIVRGTQTQTNLVPKLRRLGVKEIHFRISNPELRSHCPWGKTTKKGETLVSRLPSLEDRVKFLGIDSLEYNSIDDLVSAIGLARENLCLDCSLDCS